MNREKNNTNPSQSSAECLGENINCPLFCLCYFPVFHYMLKIFRFHDFKIKYIYLRVNTCRILSWYSSTAAPTTFYFRITGKEKSIQLGQLVSQWCSASLITNSMLRCRDLRVLKAIWIIRLMSDRCSVCTRLIIIPGQQPCEHAQETGPP